MNYALNLRAYLRYSNKSISTKKTSRAGLRYSPHSYLHLSLISDVRKHYGIRLSKAQTMRMVHVSIIPGSINISGPRAMEGHLTN